MVSSVTGLTRSGLKDFLVQRVSAIILALYSLFLVGYFLGHPHLDFAHWNGLFACTWMRLFTVLALLSLIAHAWVGMWTIFTDYIHCAMGRAVLQILVILAFIAYVVWCISILWG